MLIFPVDVHNFNIDNNIELHSHCIGYNVHVIIIIIYMLYCNLCHLTSGVGGHVFSMKRVLTKKLACITDIIHPC